MYTHVKTQNTRHFVSQNDDYEDEPYELESDGEDQKQFTSIDEKPPVGQRRSQGRSQIDNYSPSFNYEYSKDNHSRQYTPEVSEGMGSIQYERSPEQDRDDFIKKLMDKIRRQAEQLIQLENYKLLCEKRILELAPEHPLPIEISHMGNTEYGNREIQELRSLLKQKEDELAQMQREYRNVARRESPQTAEKFRRESPSKPSPPIKSSRGGNEELTTTYNNLHAKYQELVAENRALEESLRSETLASEEQRAYIDILKQMLNEKFDRNYVFKMLGGVSERDKLNALVELKNQQDKIQSLENQVEVFNNQLNQQDADFNKLIQEREAAIADRQAALDENLKVSEMNIQLSQTVKDCSEEIKRLEEEKESLIEYAAQKENKYMEISTECDNLKSENRNLNDAFENNRAELQSLQQEIDNLNQQLDDLRRKQLEHDPQLLQLHDEKKQIEEESKRNLNSFNETLVRIREEHHNLMSEKENLINSLKDEVANLRNEVRKYKDLEEKKERELQSKLRQYQNDRLREVRELETKMKIYADNEEVLKDDINKREEEINTLRESLKKFQEDNKALEDQVLSVRKINKEATNELDDLKRTIDEYEEERAVFQDRLNTLTKELHSHRDETERARTRMTEVNEMNNTLERKLQEKDQEINSFDYIMVESKNKIDRERHERLEEIKRLCEENGMLKQDLRQCREDITRFLGEIQGRDDEIAILKTYLDKKNAQNAQLGEESKYLNNRLAELHNLKEENEYLKSEHNKNMKELKDFEDLLESKNNNLRNTREKLESAEQELLNVISDLKNAQREKAEISAENGRLKRRLTESEESQRTLRVSKSEDEEKMRDIIRDNDKLKRQLHDLTKELEELAFECQRVQEESHRANSTESATREINEKSQGVLKEAIHQVKNSVTTFSGLISSNPEFETFLSKAFVKLIGDFNFLQHLKGEGDLVKLVETLKDTLEIFLMEFESLWKIAMEIQINFKESCQRINNLEKKILEIGTDEAFSKKKEAEYQREIDYLKQEKSYLERDKTQIYAREQKIEKENIELKKEVMKLQQDNIFLQNQNEDSEKNRSKLKEEWVSAKQQYDSEKRELEIMELKVEISEKGRENFDDLLQRISAAMSNPDHQRLIKELALLQRDINDFERNRASFENDLAYLESQYKDTIRKSFNAATQGKPQDVRNKADDLKADLRHANSHLNTLNKKKDILINDLKALTALEKNSSQLFTQERKTLNEIKKDIIAARDSSANRRSVLKTEPNDRPSHDYEDSAMKYASSGNKLREKDYTSPVLVERTIKHYLSSEVLNKENQNNQYETSRKSINNYASAQSARYRSVEKSDQVHENRVGSALKRYDPEPNVHMKLRDRLDHAKNMLSSIKKIHTERF